MYPTTFINQNSENNIVEAGRKHLASRMEDILFFMDFDGCEDKDDFRERLQQLGMDFADTRKAYETFLDMGAQFFEYGLAFDFCEVGTFNDQDEGFYRYQISWGGPSEEIRIYYDGTIVFVYLDWFSGVGFNITGSDWGEWIKQTFEDIGLIDWNNLDPDQIQIFEYEDETEE